MRSSLFKIILFLSCVLMILSIYTQAISDIFWLATKGIDRSYVVVAPVIAIYLAWLRRSRWRNARRQPSMLGPGIILASAVMSYLGDEFAILFLWHSAFVVAFLGVLVSFFGVRLLRDFAVPILAFFAVVPVPGGARDMIAQPLQYYAARFTTTILELCNVRAMQMGNIIEVNGVMVTVGEACDGMRLIFPIGLIMYAFVFSLPLRIEARALLISLSIPIGLLCNIFRLVPTTIAYGFFPRYADLTHDLGGLLVLPIAVISLYWILKGAQWLDLPVSRWRLAIE